MCSSSIFTGINEEIRGSQETFMWIYETIVTSPDTMVLVTVSL